ncbi:tigger transposable element-derived protein 6 [Drosophila pseudoobscura]|uniref:Tigger transposable element-derived protein 6 n=1 Tax=Drosophila pseudoobscura pseudoobscura TaxID=46245 RepID=A0A6I8UU67_DROPS|nr:tigger transposable element-derived protein 6 [Drosophila pseudoobscura]
MPPGRSRTPRRLLSLNEKSEVIQVQEKEKLSVRDLARRFNIGKTQAAGILKNKGQIDTKLKSGVNGHQKKNCLSLQGSHIDDLCFSWFTRARSENIRLSGQEVRTKAREIAQHLGYTGFSASDGWLQKWRKRHNITFHPKRETLDVQQFEAILVKSEPIMDDEEDTVISPFDAPEFIHNPITTFDEAMTQIARLKEFAKDDYVSYQQLSSLENQWTWKRNNLKTEHIP